MRFLDSNWPANLCLRGRTEAVSYKGRKSEIAFKIKIVCCMSPEFVDCLFEARDGVLRIFHDHSLRCYNFEIIKQYRMLATAGLIRSTLLALCGRRLPLASSTLRAPIRGRTVLFR